MRNQGLIEAKAGIEGDEKKIIILIYHVTEHSLFVRVNDMWNKKILLRDKLVQKSETTIASVY